MGGGDGERRNGDGGCSRLCPSNGMANHSCGLKHGIVDDINCFDVVVVSRAMH